MATDYVNLFGDLIEEPKVQKVSDILSKTKTQAKADIDLLKQLKSKKVTIEDKLAAITQAVLRILGKHQNNTKVITDRQSLTDYINKAIINGRIAIDTETDNSLDPLTCKLMGACIYTPNEKQVYIPINHTDLEGNKLPNQLTELDIKEEFQRLIDNNTNIIMHNGKFDYQVIKCTCNIALPIFWDTMIASKVLDENELAGLKWQYTNKIDPSQEKYDIEHLFAGISYALVDPAIFALYAATDAMMTDKLYEYQLEQFEDKNLAGCYKLFKEVEMPVIEVVAEMELAGVTFDTEYANRLKAKYENILAEIDLEINAELEALAPKIAKWKLTPEANIKTVKNSKSSTDAPKYNKSKVEQLEDPINLASPTQLAILLYDILKIGIIDKKTPRGTGEEVLSKIDLPICKLLLKRRGVVKLLDAFILSLPENVNPIDGRIHCKFNQFGTVTGRFSSSEPNLQQIPSHNKEIRMLFKATETERLAETETDIFEVKTYEEVLTSTGWKKATQVSNLDILIGEDNSQSQVKNINIKDNLVTIEVY